MLRPHRCWIALAALVAALLAQQPASAQEAGRHPLGQLSGFCVDGTRTTTLLLNDDTSSGALPLRSYALNWATGERTNLAPITFELCNEATGLLYGHPAGVRATPASSALRWSVAEPQPRTIARTPTHLASDGTLQIYSFGDGALWASSDGGLTWQQRRLPTKGTEPLFGLTLAPADGRALYLLAGAVPASGNTTPYTIFFSPDTGRTWQRRGAGTLSNSSTFAPALQIRSLESSAASVESVVITTSSNSSGRYGTATTYLSTDGGRTFANVATSGAYLYGGRVLQTRTGLLRLSGIVGGPSDTSTNVYLERSGDGGANWEGLPLPAVVRPEQTPSLFITQSFAAPDALLLSYGSEGLWFSPDGARNWQSLGRGAAVHFTPSLPLSALLRDGDQYVVQDLPDVGASLVQPGLAKGLPGGSFFPETGHNLGGVFKSAWEKKGGLAQFGYPRSEPVREVNPADGRVYLVQYFERNRFEYHPEFAGTPNEVLLGLLGNQVTAARRAAGEQPFQPVPNPNTSIFFPQTGHTLDGPFRRYWAANGAEQIYGYPISEPFSEVNAADGQSYTVQYFERARFEYHPEHAGTRADVLLGLLGNQVIHDKGWE